MTLPEMIGVAAAGWVSGFCIGLALGIQAKSPHQPRQRYRGRPTTAPVGSYQPRAAQRPCNPPPRNP